MLGVDDELLKESNRSIPRADVAELCVQSLSQCEAQNRSGLVPFQHHDTDTCRGAQLKEILNGVTH